MYVVRGLAVIERMFIAYLCMRIHMIHSNLSRTCDAITEGLEVFVSFDVMLML